MENENDNDNHTTVISADFIYLVLLGSQKIMDSIVTKLNHISGSNKKTSNKIKYLYFSLEQPCAEMIHPESISYIENGTPLPTFSNKNDYVMLAEGIETAQCLVYAEGYGNYYMLMEMSNHHTHRKVSYPIIQLDDEISPEKLITSWIVDNDIVDIAREITIKPGSIIGKENDIFVFIGIINNK
jgi:hypothetical protein